MAKAVDHTQQDNAVAHNTVLPRTAPQGRDWRKSMSDNVAYALLVYTGLQIFVTIGALKEGTSTILPYFALIVLVAAIIPACHAFEGRWKYLNDAEAQDPALTGRFRRDQLMLWILAIGLPFLFTGLFKAIFAFT